MDLYIELAKVPTFKIEDVNRYYNNIASARSAVKRLLSKGKALKIRNNLYTCVSAEHGGPIANRFQIASAINDTSYVSHHSAMEFYGITDQMMYEIYVSSDHRFQDFEFDGYHYHYIKSRLSEGVDTPAYSGGIRVTDKERTIADILKDMDKIGGIEECIANIGSITVLDEKKLLRYMDLYNNKFLYQKAGYLLWDKKDALGLSDEFFDICRSKIGKSKRYLTADIKAGSYIEEWRLVVPASGSISKNGEGVINADI